ncbi:MAG: hypothetical protein IJ220_02980 [Clostridia bacterium]|nr:hypothetical protein [Clostridia bacterium]
MNYSFYYPKTAEEEVRHWMDFLKQERGIKSFPDIPAGKVMTLAWHKGHEICFKRIGLGVGQLIIETYDPISKEASVRPLYPYIQYWTGEPEDKLVLDQESENAFKNEQEELEKLFRTNLQEGIVPFS